MKNTAVVISVMCVVAALAFLYLKRSKKEPRPIASQSPRGVYTIDPESIEGLMDVSGIRG